VSKRVTLFKNVLFYKKSETTGLGKEKKPFNKQTEIATYHSRSPCPITTHLDLNPCYVIQLSFCNTEYYSKINRHLF
jgi:hypothetical protein